MVPPTAMIRFRNMRRTGGMWDRCASPPTKLVAARMSQESPMMGKDHAAMSRWNPRTSTIQNRAATTLASTIRATPRSQGFRTWANGQLPAMARMHTTYAPMVLMPMEAYWAEGASMNSPQKGSQNAQEAKARITMRTIHGSPRYRACTVGMPWALGMLVMEAVSD